MEISHMNPKYFVSTHLISLDFIQLVYASNQNGL